MTDPAYPVIILPGVRPDGHSSATSDVHFWGSAAVLIAWTGHRPDIFADPGDADQLVTRAAREIIDQGATEFVVGGQRGVDLWAGEAALAVGLPIQVILPTPPAHFSRTWDRKDARRLESLLDQASEVTLVDPEITLGALAYDRRNELLVSPAQLLIAVWTGLRAGGTFYTICAATASGVPSREYRLNPAADPSPGRGL
jgi:uncharacterized phage-like protein YoqJ